MDLAAGQNPQRKSTQDVLKAGMKNRNTDELQQLLAHADMRVRMAAQFELVKRNEKQIFINTLQAADDELAMLHAIWGVGQLFAK